MDVYTIYSMYITDDVKSRVRVVNVRAGGWSSTRKEKGTERKRERREGCVTVIGVGIGGLRIRDFGIPHARWHTDIPRTLLYTDHRGGGGGGGGGLHHLLVHDSLV